MAASALFPEVQLGQQQSEGQSREGSPEVREGGLSRCSGSNFPAAFQATVAEVKIFLHLLHDPTLLICLLMTTGHLGVVVHICDPSTHKVEAERSGVQGHPWLNSTFKASLGYIRLVF